MSRKHSTGPDDSNDGELEEYLRGGSEVSRRYRAAANEAPPAELDRMVMVRARAMERTEWLENKSFPRRSRAQWALPFAVAATVVVSFAIFHDVSMHPQRMPEEPAQIIVPVATSFDSPAGPVAAAAVRPAAELPATQLWLETIRKLRAEGKDEDADVLLERFLKVYPDYFEHNPEVKRP
jgi:hypothetical protein